MALKMNPDNINEIYYFPEYDEPSEYQVISTHADSIFIYETQLPQMDEYPLISFLGKKVKNQKDAELYFISQDSIKPHLTPKSTSINITDDERDMLGYDHSWLPGEPIILYIKNTYIQSTGQVSQDLYSYSLADNREEKVNLQLNNIRQITISSVGEKIAFCEIGTTRIIIADLKY